MDFSLRCVDDDSYDLVHSHVVCPVVQCTIIRLLTFLTDVFFYMLLDPPVEVSNISLKLMVSSWYVTIVNHS